MKCTGIEAFCKYFVHTACDPFDLITINTPSKLNEFLIMTSIPVPYSIEIMLFYGFAFYLKSWRKEDRTRKVLLDSFRHTESFEYHFIPHSVDIHLNSLFLPENITVHFSTYYDDYVKSWKTVYLEYCEAGKRFVSFHPAFRPLIERTASTHIIT